MSDKKKGKQRKNLEEAPTKEEYAVAKYLRFGIPIREGKLHGMEVKCFIGSVAVDKLMESKWSSSINKIDPLFTSRLSCVSYMLRLLQKGLFHRAEREKRKKDKDKEKDRPKKKKKEKDGAKEESVKADVKGEELAVVPASQERKGKKERKAKKDREVEVYGDDVIEKTDSTEKKTEKKEEKKKKEKRLKLVMPEEQFFEDGDEVYVWIYDPVNAKTFFIGLLMVLGAIGLCMFPLWPEEVRIGVYYLSLCAAGFVGFILFLVVVRLILFCCVWVLTVGRHHFWLLPNLTEDVGFLDSFKPLYHHERASSDDSKPKVEGEKRKKKKKKLEEGKTDEEESKEKDKDTKDKQEKSSDKDDSDEFEVIKKEDVPGNGEDKDDGEIAEDNENDDAEDDDNDLGVDDDEDDEDDNDNEDEDIDGEENRESEEDEYKDEKKKTK